MSDFDRALAQVSDIRAQMAASTRFRAFGPGPSLVTGVLALLVAFVQTLYPGLLPLEGTGFVAVWSAVILASAFVEATEILARARRLHGTMARTMVGSTLRRILPFAAAMMIVTLVICGFAPQITWLVPGIWLMLIALAGVSALPGLPKAMVWAAAWYFASATVVLILGGWLGRASPWMMGIPLGGGQIMVAFIFNRASGGQDV